ncbi:RNA ligase 1-like [Ptychodera flava]|uniref:RNA ligase 1-like n=1 Tax=Ptychodera flava TaxID=63121 RepID=UPI00396A5169
MSGSVQNKVPCVFKTIVVEGKSSKRAHQQYKVVASREIKEIALQADIEQASPTEKIDGTCVYVHDFQGKPWLWARHDRKPTKQADKKFKRYQTNQRTSELDGETENEVTPWQWNAEKDFREAPENWIPAKGVPVIDGIAQPDENGHIPGWVPLDKNNRQYCWHNTVVDHKQGVAVVLRPSADGNKDELEVSISNLSSLLERTLELIGTNINANPYGIGCKKNPIHLLIPHGAIGLNDQLTVNYDDLKEWFETKDNGKVEGLVWHCKNGELFKFHRHHFGLPWPVDDLHLCRQPIRFALDPSRFECDFDAKSMFTVLSQFDGQLFDQMKDIPWGEGVD